MYAFYHWKVIPINEHDEDSSRSKFHIINLQSIDLPLHVCGNFENQSEQSHHFKTDRHLNNWQQSFFIACVIYFPQWPQIFAAFMRSGNDRQIASHKMYFTWCYKVYLNCE